MRQRRPGPRRLGEVELRRLDLAVRDRVDARRRARRVAAHELEDALGGERVAERVHGLVERGQLGLELRAVAAERHAEQLEPHAAAVELLHEREPVGEARRGDRLELGDRRVRRGPEPVANRVQLGLRARPASASTCFGGGKPMPPEQQVEVLLRLVDAAEQRDAAGSPR